jgi:hypothetical protein
MFAKHPMTHRLASVGVVLGICVLACSVTRGMDGGSVRSATATPSQKNTVLPSLEATDIPITETETPSPIPATKTGSPTKSSPEITFKEIDNPGFYFDQMMGLTKLKPGGYFSFLGSNMDISETDSTLSVFYISSDLTTSGQLFRMARWSDFSQEGYYVYGGSNQLFLNEGSYQNSHSMILSFNSSYLRVYSFFAGSQRVKCRFPSQDRDHTEIIRLVCSSEVDVLVQLSLKEDKVLSVQYFADRYDYYRWVNNEILVAAPNDGGKSTTEYYCLFDVSQRKEECHLINFHVEFISDDVQWVVISYPENSTPSTAKSQSSKRMEGPRLFYIVPLTCIQIDYPQLNGDCAPIQVIEPDDLAPDDWLSSYTFAYADTAKMIFGGDSSDGGLLLWSFDIQTRKMENIYSSGEHYSCNQWNRDRKGFFCDPADPSGHPIFISSEGVVYNLTVKGFGLSEFFLS